MRVRRRGARGCALPILTAGAAELAIVAILDFGDSGLIYLPVDGDARQGSQKVGVHVGVSAREEALHIGLVRKVRAKRSA